MKNIDTYIKFYVKDVVFVIIFTIVISFIWLSYINNKDLNIKNIGYTFLNDNVKYSTMAINDEEALRKVETQNILVYNMSIDTERYDLILKLSNKEKLDNLKVNVNFIVRDIDDYTYYEKDDYLYYILDSNMLSNESFKYVVSLWNNVSEDEDNTFDYEFLII